jgi:hypothetical protein
VTDHPRPDSDYPFAEYPKLSVTDALTQLIDAIDETHAFIDLEGGGDENGPVVRACEALGRPIPPQLAACFDKHRPPWKEVVPQDIAP